MSTDRQKPRQPRIEPDPPAQGIAGIDRLAALDGRRACIQTTEPGSGRRLAG